MDRSGSEKPEGGVWSAGRVGNGFGTGAKNQDFHFLFLVLEGQATECIVGPPKRLGGMQRQAAGEALSMDRSGSEEPEGGVWSSRESGKWFWGRSEKSGFSLSLSMC